MGFTDTKEKILNLLRKGQVDRAVFYGILGKVWSLISWPITLYLISTVFNAQIQGYYFTFTSLLGLQFFIELG